MQCNAMQCYAACAVRCNSISVHPPCSGSIPVSFRRAARATILPKKFVHALCLFHPVAQQLLCLTNCQRSCADVPPTGLRRSWEPIIPMLPTGSAALAMAGNSRSYAPQLNNPISSTRIRGIDRHPGIYSARPPTDVTSISSHIWSSQIHPHPCEVKPLCLRCAIPSDRHL
jgi:hypothetical protein